MSRLIYRLTQKDYGDVPLNALDAMTEAADRIEALEAENKALRTATPEMIAAAWEFARKGRPNGKVFGGPGPAFKEVYEAMAARAILAKEPQT